MSQITVTDIIAVVFDFDDTLMPDSTSKFLRAHGIKPEEFWPQASALLKEGYDQPSAYLKLLFENVGEGKPLGKLSNLDLSKFGETIDGDFYSGLPEFFVDIRTQISGKFRNIEIEFYIVSGGLQAILQGSPTLSKFF